MGGRSVEDPLNAGPSIHAQGLFTYPSHLRPLTFSAHHAVGLNVGGGGVNFWVLRVAGVLCFYSLNLD